MNTKLQLNDVTLVMIDCINYADALYVFNAMNSIAHFGDALFFCDKPVSPDVVLINTIRSLEEYSTFVVRNLYSYITTKFLLIVQTDGFIIHPQSWSDEFLAYDYIGSPEYWKYYKTWKVGNGGFSLRSKNLMQTYKDMNNTHPEDLQYVKAIEETQSHSIAPYHVAIKFGYSLLNKNNTSIPFNTPFGFHGKGILPQYNCAPLEYIRDYYKL